MTRALTCPKCRKPMETVRFQEVEVDRCTWCKGIWFDLLEHVALKNRRGSEAVDAGATSERVQALHDDLNQKGEIDCPVCHIRMVRLVDKRQSHIWYEKCQSCSGVFLDAGELTDLKHETMGDVLKDLFTPKRT
ncbi:MAG: zf-TFIIB domain-containing protein [Planctomycetes bacterium]|nr:zf-TFIIB domain-containing protein [Planctomycetota bacterium]